MNQTFVKSVTEQLPQLGLLQDEPMKKHTTFRIGGSADYYAEPRYESNFKAYRDG